MNWQEGMAPSDRMLSAEQEEEKRLAAQARAGAEWALTALIARYQPSVVRYLTRLTGNPDLARSLAERIFVRMERRLHGPHGAEQLRLWLLRACTEAGLDALRRPKRKKAPPRLQPPSPPRGLLPERAGAEPVRRLLSGWGRIKQATNTTGRQVRQLIWTIRAEATGRQAWDAHEWQGGGDSDAASPLSEASELHEPLEDDLDALDPREALRHRLVRVVLAELPYGDAQCLALHLVAGLNQAEVARALGLTASATRKRIVHGLQAFSTRYAAAIANLGIPAELGYQDRAPASAAVERGSTIPAAQGALLPPVAASVPPASYDSLLGAEALDSYASPPMTDIEQEPTMRLWPPITPTPAPPSNTPEPVKAAQPIESAQQHPHQAHEADPYETDEDDSAAATTSALPVVGGAPAAEEAEPWDESDEWGWEQADTQTLQTLPAQTPDLPVSADEWDETGVDTQGEAGAQEREPTPETEPAAFAEEASEEVTAVTAAQAEANGANVAGAADGAPAAAMQPERLDFEERRETEETEETEEAEQQDELIPDEVDEGAITQPSLQRIARQAAIEEARRQLAANAGNVERNGVLTSLAHDAVIWPVVDALPVAPAASSARLTYLPDTPDAGSRSQASPESGPLSYEVSEVSSLGTVEVAVEQEGKEGSTQREAEVALGYEAPVEQNHQERE